MKTRNAFNPEWTTRHMENAQEIEGKLELEKESFVDLRGLSFSIWIPIAVKTSAAWFLVGIFTVLVACEPQSRLAGIIGFSLLGSLVTGDLLALAWVVKIVVEITKKQREKVSGQTIQLLLLGTAKLACLLGIILVLKVGRHFPSVSLLMGISTLVIVPILSGVIADARTASL